ncbi:molybdenum cofactor guanylyltransferase MobA [Paracoccus sp. 11-3]|uniref:Molybdenum cofactor guanylyltransferase n=1 Tax=Paracoccus amoyensis TaxID=2760093 RepID=A0A926GCA4_9RHOB|nr:molybdenum cofactor guanylyltransferase MobA [Paracoccus amoyensis]MBC9246480.1 molybdenum cofactor guanylyltransferase MobA [Paracoccus amoyensis]
MERYPAIILAGGRATRMGGGDKPMRMLGDQPMLHHIIDRLRPQSGTIALNANGDPSRFATYGLPVIADSLPNYPGPLAGILAGMDWAAGLNATAILTAAGDTPFFPHDLLDKFTASYDGQHPVLAASRDADGNLAQHPIFGLWPTRLRDELRAYLLAGYRRVRDFADRNGAEIAVWDAGKIDPFFNVNTGDDLSRARQLIEKPD